MVHRHRARHEHAGVPPSCSHVFMWCVHLVTTARLRTPSSHLRQMSPGCVYRDSFFWIPCYCSLPSLPFLVLQSSTINSTSASWYMKVFCLLLTILGHFPLTGGSG